MVEKSKKSGEQRKNHPVLSGDMTFFGPRRPTRCQALRLEAIILFHVYEPLLSHRSSWFMATAFQESLCSESYCFITTTTCPPD